jgi:deoxyadenosine/deoxycytidine kinase
VETHPFLEPFYKNPQAFAFEKNLFFLLDYLHQIKSAQNGDFVFDHSAVVHRSYANLNRISAVERPVFQALDQLTESTGAPDLLINLVCAPDMIMQRIKKRGRAFEAEVTIDYVSALHAEIQKQVMAVSHYMPVLNLDAASYDFDARPDDNERIVTLVKRELSGGPERLRLSA